MPSAVNHRGKILLLLPPCQSFLFLLHHLSWPSQVSIDASIVDDLDFGEAVTALDDDDDVVRCSFVVKKVEESELASLSTEQVNIYSAAG